MKFRKDCSSPQKKSGQKRCETKGRGCGQGGASVTRSRGQGEGRGRCKSPEFIESDDVGSVRKGLRRELRIHKKSTENLNKSSNALGIIINDELCTGCKLCERECPHSAVAVKNNKAAIDKNLCSSCMRCVDVCPSDAISINNGNK